MVWAYYPVVPWTPGHRPPHQIDNITLEQPLTAQCPNEPELTCDVQSTPVVVGLNHQGDGSHVEHDLPRDEAFPGELDDALVRHVGEEVAVELAVALEDLDEELAVVEEVEDPVHGVDSVDDPGEVVDDVVEVVVVLERLEGLVEVEEEKKEHDKQVEEAENGAPIAPARRHIEDIKRGESYH